MFRLICILFVFLLFKHVWQFLTFIWSLFIHPSLWHPSFHTETFLLPSMSLSHFHVFLLYVIHYVYLQHRGHDSGFTSEESDLPPLPGCSHNPRNHQLLIDLWGWGGESQLLSLMVKYWWGAVPCRSWVDGPIGVRCNEQWLYHVHISSSPDFYILYTLSLGEGHIDVPFSDEIPPLLIWHSGQLRVSVLSITPCNKKFFWWRLCSTDL